MTYGGSGLSQSLMCWQRQLCSDQIRATAVRKALSEFARMGGDRAEVLSGDLRDEQGYRASLLNRHLLAECMSADGFAERVASKVGGATRAMELIAGMPVPHLPPSSYTYRGNHIRTAFL
eukprot:SAG11_NODE_1364_length_5109_cov_2.966866_9_plen_120_part_00